MALILPPPQVVGCFGGQVWTDGENEKKIAGCYLNFIFEYDGGPERGDLLLQTTTENH